MKSDVLLEADSALKGGWGGVESIGVEATRRATYCCCLPFLVIATGGMAVKLCSIVGYCQAWKSE